MTKRYFIFLAYNGENYCGWQSQPKQVTVQETIETAMSTSLRQPISIVGAGRTDSGVHARSMMAHFDCDIDDFKPDDMVYKLTHFLPKDIAVQRIVQVNAEAHARFDALSRTYRYYVTTVKDPFNYKLKYKINGELDIDAMNACADVMKEYIDFTSFSKLHTDVKTNDCNIMYAQWIKEGDDYIFTIKANRFLRNMVRSVVGTLLDAGRGKIGVAEMRAIIEAKDRGRAGFSAPAHGLFLEDVEYSDTVFSI